MPATLVFTLVYKGLEPWPPGLYPARYGQGLLQSATREWQYGSFVT